MKQDGMPLISIELYLTGSELDFDAISSDLGIIPTKTRVKNSWPQISLDMGLAHDSWSLSTGYKEALTVSSPFEDLIESFSGKKEVLKRLINQYNLECTFVVVIDAQGGKKPDVVLTKKCVNFASEIYAEIYFDLCYS